MKTFKTDEEMQAVFDAGEESMTAYADLSTLKKPGKKAQRTVNVVMSDAMISELDGAAERACVTRQSLIKLWLRERLDVEASKVVQIHGDFVPLPREPPLERAVAGSSAPC